jgi:hypothetical protein
MKVVFVDVGGVEKTHHRLQAKVVGSFKHS